MSRPAPAPRELIGVVNANKPIGWSSAKVVTAVRAALGGRRAAKVGHAGTLDPMASGVLVLLVGRATRLAELLMNSGKTYLADVRLGAVSSTDDREGEIVEQSAGPAEPSDAQLRDVLARFVGTISQRPPAHSAVKIDGKRSYKLARRGRSIEPAARPVTIHAIELLDYRWPTLRLRLDCGRGVYVRSLARDIGSALGVGGYLAGLCRTRVGPFVLADAIDPARCRADNASDWLLGPETAVAGLPADRCLRLSDLQVGQLGQGVALPGQEVDGVDELLRSAAGQGADQTIIEPVAALDGHGRLVALCRIRDGRLWPTAVLRDRPADRPDGSSVDC